MRKVFRDYLQGQGSSLMAGDVAAAIKRENDDREHNALWQELTKYQMTCTDDYTEKVLDEQIRKHCDDVETRRSAISISQSYIESLLESSASIYDTANGGVQVLSDTVSHAEAELENFCTRVEELRKEREQALDAATRFVTQRKVKLGEIYQRCLQSKDHQSGLQKLTVLLSKLEEEIAERKAAIKRLDIQKKDTCKEVAEQQQSLQLLLSKSSAKNTLTSCADENDILSEIAILEQEQVSDDEKLHTLHCLQEELHGRFKDAFEKKDWDEQTWQKILEEQSEEGALLDSKIVKMNEDIALMNDTVAQPKEDGNVAEAILALERDLLSYVGLYNEERRRIQEQRTEILSRLNDAQNKVATLKASNVEKEGEHQTLLLEVKNRQAQIDAFTNLRTPAKEVVTPGAKSRKTTTGRRSSRRIEGVDSDDGSSPSGVPFVEGLQPFSPATISLKEQAREKSKKAKKCKQIEEAMDVSQPPKNSSTAEAPLTSPKPSDKLVPALDMQECPQAEENASVIESLFDLSGSDKSSPHETLVAKRFPNDIFLRKSPSLGQNESGSSPDVSAMGSTDFDTDREDADQSVWSVVATKPANCTHLDTTAETDLDQSVW
ncbi:hypothetical protein ANCCEY_05509 [Ancylostoma ceylanicum]|uniref:Uncharacterized protein n=1 Tax=Ancylostoma ceylanicum TaxID=53326 RepID=A0A0D6LTM0_9BILA|nr:hypothetical protein ANCCEY_05509 [Ancylostoma ceylanicum]